MQRLKLCQEPCNEMYSADPRTLVEPRSGTEMQCIQSLNQ